MPQRVFVKGRQFDVSDPELETALDLIYGTPERPRCLCVEGGVDLYISRRPSGYCLARMPGTGGQHHPTCTDYEPSPSVSGRGALMGDGIVEKSPELLELHIGFAMSKSTGRAIPRGEPTPPKDVHTAKKRLSLQAVLHLLYEYARFNRWYPNMGGMRNQGVLCKYLGDAAEHVVVQGEPLSRRLYIPEPFNADRKDEIAARRREKLAFLNSTKEGTEFPFALIIGEFKEVKDGSIGRKIFVKHMPDTPLHMEDKAWSRVERVYGPIIEAREADVAHKPKVLMAAVIYAKQEGIYQVDRLSIMLVSDQYLPINGTFELPLLDRLQQEQRMFIKPLQYDAPSAAAFANFLLLDARAEDGSDYPLHIVSPLADAKDQTLKTAAIVKAGHSAWMWKTEEGIPALPPVRRYQARSAQNAVAADSTTG